MKASRVKSDERVVLFPTVAHLDEVAGEWVIPIHGWIYEPVQSTLRKAAFAHLFQERYGLVIDQTTQCNFDKRVNLLLGDNERGKRLSIRLAGEDFLMPKSRPNGHFEDVVRLSLESVKEAEKKGTLRFSINLLPGDSRQFEGTVFLWKPTGLTVLSDIDDTVKVTGVESRRSLFDNTFFQDFSAVERMVDRFEEWARRGAAFHFVSSSPWHLYEPIFEFLEEEGFPKASASLKTIRFTDRTFFNLFRKGSATKPIQIQALLDRFPGRKFIFVGDSGEEDPEVYAKLYRKHPEQVEGIYIRNVTGAGVSDSRFSQIFNAIPDHIWCLFSDPSELIL